MIAGGGPESRRDSPARWPLSGDDVSFFSATGPGSDTGTIGIRTYRETWVPSPPTWTGNYSYVLGELKADGSLASSLPIAASTAGLGATDLAVSADGTGAADWWINSGSPSWNETRMTSKLTRDTGTCGVNPAACKSVLGVASITPKKGTLKAGKAMKVKITVKNTGDKDASGVTATVKSGNKQVKVPKKVSFGSIAIGAAVPKMVNVKAKAKKKKKGKKK